MNEPDSPKTSNRCSTEVQAPFAARSHPADTSLGEPTSRLTPGETQRGGDIEQATTDRQLPTLHTEAEGQELALRVKAVESRLAEMAQAQAQAQPTPLESPQSSAAASTKDPSRSKFLRAC